MIHFSFKILFRLVLTNKIVLYALHEIFVIANLSLFSLYSVFVSCVYEIIKAIIFSKASIFHKDIQCRDEFILEKLLLLQAEFGS